MNYAPLSNKLEEVVEFLNTIVEWDFRVMVWQGHQYELVIWRMLIVREKDLPVNKIRLLKITSFSTVLHDFLALLKAIVSESLSQFLELK